MRILIALLAIGAFVLPQLARAQDGSSSETFEMDGSAPAAEPSEIADAEPSPLVRDWREYSSRFGDFRVRLPGLADERTKQNPNGVEQNDFIAKKNGTTYAFATIKPPAGQIADGANVEAFTITLLISLTTAAGMTGRSFEPKFDRRFLYDGAPAGEGRLVGSDGVARARIRALVAGGCYVALVASNDAGLEGAPIDDFFRTLRLH